jgi:hypothetical protein
MSFVPSHPFERDAVNDPPSCPETTAAMALVTSSVSSFGSDGGAGIATAVHVAFIRLGTAGAVGRGEDPTTFMVASNGWAGAHLQRTSRA